SKTVRSGVAARIDNLATHARIGHLRVHRRAGEFQRAANRGEQAISVVGSLGYDEAAEGRRGYGGVAERASAELVVAGPERVNTCAGQCGSRASDPPSAIAPTKRDGPIRDRRRYLRVAILGDELLSWNKRRRDGLLCRRSRLSLADTREH